MKCLLLQCMVLVCIVHRAFNFLSYLKVERMRCICLSSIMSKHQHTRVHFSHQWQREGRRAVKNHDKVEFKYIVIYICESRQ